MKTKKKAFTLIELLVVMVVTMVVMVLLITLLSSTFKVYNETTTRENTYAYVLLMISDVETLSRGCDYVLTDNDDKVLKIVSENKTFSVNSNDYGIDASFTVDNTSQIITISYGGDEYCVKYVQNPQR
jgi:type II secretory pathway pseudopilin PulG